MFTHQRFPVSLSLISLDLPVRSAVDTSAPSTYPLSKGAFSLPPAVELPYGAREHPCQGATSSCFGCLRGALLARSQAEPWERGGE